MNNNLAKNFVARHEDFVCKNCGENNPSLASGTRNHCRKCLHSLHVDLELPGDRASACGGLMRPVGAVQKKGEWTVVQSCEKCGHMWQNRLSADDNFDVILGVIRNPLPPEFL